MKISQKGLYALQAMMMLARRYNQGAIAFGTLPTKRSCRKNSSN